MKFKRIISIVLILCMAFSVAACKKGGDSKEVVKGFMGSLTSYDVNKMAKYLEDVPSTGENYVYDVFTDAHYVDLYQEAYKDNLTYKVISVKGNAVKIKVTMPDLVSLYNDTVVSLSSAATSDDSMFSDISNLGSEANLVVIAYMIDAVKNGDVDTISKEFSLKLGNINGEMKIMNNEQLEQVMTSQLCGIQLDSAESAE